MDIAWLPVLLGMTSEPCKTLHWGLHACEARGDAKRVLWYSVLPNV